MPLNEEPVPLSVVIKHWLNTHSLTVSAVGFSAIVMLLFGGAGWLARTIGFPYLKLEGKAGDYVALLGRPAPKDPRLVFVADDYASHILDQLWPEDLEASSTLRLMKKHSWSRQIFADVLDRLAGAGAKVVAFDYMYQGEDDADSALRASIDKHASKVVVGCHIDESGVANNPMPKITPPSNTILGEASDPRVGFVNMWPDADEVIRRMRFRVMREELANMPASADSIEYESFAARIVRQAGEADKIPTGRGEHRIRYAYKGETLREQTKPMSLFSIFVPSFWEANYQNGAFFKDKIVIVGPEGNYTKDVGESPFGTIAGPEFHLNSVNAILTGEFLHDVPRPVQYLLIGLGGAVGWCLCYFIRNSIIRIALIPVVAFGVFTLAVVAYNASHIFPVFSPLLALTGTVVTATAWQQLVERLERTKLRKTFERYVSRDVVKELLDNPLSYLNTIGGMRKNVTVLFSDIRGFTTITESGDAQGLVTQLNEYFHEMVNLVFENHGTLDKFIGDAVMAQWGGIYSEGVQTDAIHAVRTAVQMRKSLVRLNQRWKASGKLQLQFGIGINHGEAIVGNLGCDAKMEVSLIGDAVNTASRFEGMTKEFHVDLLIGETVERHIRAAFIIRPVVLSLPKGKTHPVEIFTVIDERCEGVNPPNWLRDYLEGVRLYRTRQFAEAITCFESVLAMYPEDWLSREYIEWCRDYIETPPDESWNGVYVMTKK